MPEIVETLLPCPFCGEKAERFPNRLTDRMVNCRSCGAAAFDKKWQRRIAAPKPASADREAVRDVIAVALADCYLCQPHSMPWEDRTGALADAVMPLIPALSAQSPSGEGWNDMIIQASRAAWKAEPLAGFPLKSREDYEAFRYGCDCACEAVRALKKPAPPVEEAI